METNFLIDFAITHIEAQVLLTVTLIAVLLQALIYQRIQFTRILGIVHLTWLPMFAWFAKWIAEIQMETALTIWIAVLAVTNAMV